MFYRRKILLAILESFDNSLDKMSLQKLLMLFSKMQDEPSFHFVPYKYGCFSFQANADLSTMTKYEQVIVNANNWVKTDIETYSDKLKAKDKIVLKNIIRFYKHKTKDELVKLTYVRYPYFAINSKIASDILNKEELEKVHAKRPVNNDKALYTIGYEGISLEEYINKLIRFDIKLLCDVRHNAFSMKYGFSKKQLQNACENVGIQYIHIPEVGIVSDKRKELNSQSDYDVLLETYKMENLKNTRIHQEQILGFLREYNRVAITCFEANICQCHRKPLAEAIAQLPDFNYELKHI